MNKIFENVGEPNLQRTQFNLGYNHRFDCDIGEMIPCYYQECIPGDRFKINTQILARMNPMIYPVLDNLTAKIRYFFVPTRLMWDKWEDFITGIEKGSIPPKEFTDKQPEWKPVKNGKHTLWDYLGLPIGIDPAGAYPLPWPKRAYNLIYNEYYRDENLQELVDIDQEEVLLANWNKDYFTSALPFRQKGTAPSIPLTGTASSVFQKSKNVAIPLKAGVLSASGIIYPEDITFERRDNTSPVYLDTLTKKNMEGVYKPNTKTGAYINTSENTVVHQTGTQAITVDQFLEKNNIDLSNLGTFNVSDLRDITQLQKWMERNARAGTRYIEFLKGHWKKSPSDKTLQRPEYIGGMATNINISEVLQTSQSDANSPQGNLAGHGLTASGDEVGNYEVEEYGWIIGILTIAPNVSYQQGINKMLLRKSRLEQVYPEFVNLSEQAIKGAEIYATNNEVENNKIFGYTGIYDEMRIRYSMTSGELRDKLDFMVMTRKFATKPALNSDFIKCKPEEIKRIFAVQDEKGFIINVYNDVKAIRPLPLISEPGLIDHN